MEELLTQQGQIQSTKNIQVVKDWLSKYHARTSKEKEDNPIFSMGDIEFDYFESTDRQGGRYDINYRKPNYRSVDFEELISMGLAEFSKIDDNEIYFMDENYTFEVVYRSDIVNDFINLIEAQSN